MDFGLFYFDGEGAVRRPNQYRLLLDSARFADENGFTAVWTPERHFHAFGGLYPNPVVTSAALATVTQNVQIRGGSVVAPLHHPVRLAEDWAVVDNLSGGRVAMAFAPGWTVPEFALSAKGHAARYEALWDCIDAVRRPWEGEEVEFPVPGGEPVRVRTLPRPLQRRLPLWVTASSEPGFERAASIGAPVLTSLLNTTLEEVAAKVARYREALAEHGHDPASGRVALMVHTFVGPDLETVREQIEAPFHDYLKSHYHLLDGLAQSLGLGVGMDDLTPADLETLLRFGFEGFLDGRSLIGGVRELRPLVESFASAGIDEIACLIDFHPGYEEVLGSLEHLAALKADCFGLAPQTTV
ncbi:MAG: MupA/Atu3671 family FMN-dependent luciferase-like monooxygenase [Planctomycetota bacterium]